MRSVVEPWRRGDVGLCRVPKAVCDTKSRPVSFLSQAQRKGPISVSVIEWRQANKAGIMSEKHLRTEMEVHQLIRGIPEFDWKQRKLIEDLLMEYAHAGGASHDTLTLKIIHQLHEMRDRGEIGAHGCQELETALNEMYEQ